MTDLIKFSDLINIMTDLMNALKCRNLGVRACANLLKAHALDLQLR